MHCFEQIKPADKNFKLIQENWPPREFTRDFCISYQNQVPNVAILLISGEVEIIQGSKITKVKFPALFAIKELLERQTLDYSIHVTAGSIACLIDRATLIEQAFAKQLIEQYLPSQNDKIIS